MRWLPRTSPNAYCFASAIVGPGSLGVEDDHVRRVGKALQPRRGADRLLLPALPERAQVSARIPLVDAVAEAAESVDLLSECPAIREPSEIEAGDLEQAIGLCRAGVAFDELQ